MNFGLSNRESRNICYQSYLQHIFPCTFNISWLTESPHYHSIHFWKLSTKGEGFVFAFEFLPMQLPAHAKVTTTPKFSPLPLSLLLVQIQLQVHTCSLYSTTELKHFKVKSSGSAGCSQLVAEVSTCHFIMLSRCSSVVISDVVTTLVFIICIRYSITEDGQCWHSQKKHLWSPHIQKDLGCLLQYCTVQFVKPPSW